jgi:two-component system response regulator MprA
MNLATAPTRQRIYARRASSALMPATPSPLFSAASPLPESQQPAGASRLLIVDDDAEMRLFLRQELEQEGYVCEEAANGQQALSQLRSHSWDLVLLDWSMPGITGVELCRRLRHGNITTPVLMLTARDEVCDRVEALDSGADDYLTKPFSLDELLARVRARLRRSELVTQESPTVLRLADLELNLASHEVRRSGIIIKLSLREFELISYLLKRPGQVHSRQEILREVWGPTFVGDDNLLDVYVGYLRRKLESPGLPILIQTVRGVGFMAKQGPIKN